MNLSKLIMTKTKEFYSGISVLWLAIFGAWHDNPLVLLIEALCASITYNIVTLIWALNLREKKQSSENDAKKQSNQIIESLQENNSGLIEERAKLLSIIQTQKRQMLTLNGIVHLVYGKLTKDQRIEIHSSNEEINRLLDIPEQGENENEKI